MSKKCLIFYIWGPSPPLNFESIGYRGLSKLQLNNVPIRFIYIPLSFNNYFKRYAFPSIRYAMQRLLHII